MPCCINMKRQITNQYCWHSRQMDWMDDVCPEGNLYLVHPYQFHSRHSCRVARWWHDLLVQWQKRHEYYIKHWQINWYINQPPISMGFTERWHGNAFDNTIVTQQHESRNNAPHWQCWCITMTLHSGNTKHIVHLTQTNSDATTSPWQRWR